MIKTKDIQNTAVNNKESLGAVYTRREIVELMLDTVGYVPSRNLSRMRILEPCFGGGDFLIPIVERLLKSIAKQKTTMDARALRDVVRAVEIDPRPFVNMKGRLFGLLRESGFNESDAESLVSAWLLPGDFLLNDMDGGFDFVVGNPPYVRQEALPQDSLRTYRQMFSTMADRADIYVPFFEKALGMLNDSGRLSYICSDRWLKNQYGKQLRKYVAESYSLTHYFDTTNVEAFHDDVSAYTGISIFQRGPQRGVVVCGFEMPVGTDKVRASELPKIIRQHSLKMDGKKYIQPTGDAWLIGGTDNERELLEVLSKFPLIEEAGCKVRIGVATGKDEVFIGTKKTLDVEKSRLVPLVMRDDIREGSIEWGGRYVINTSETDGRLIDLKKYPQLNGYFLDNEAKLLNRHVARKHPVSWYRTIDKVHPHLVKERKILIPDISIGLDIVIDEGDYYPHHNLYFITSEEWNLEALRAVLRSDVTKAAMMQFSTKMRGGYVRYQAQYLRKLRIPKWNDVNDGLRKDLVLADRSNDQKVINKAVSKLFGVDAAKYVNSQLYANSN